MNVKPKIRHYKTLQDLHGHPVIRTLMHLCQTREIIFQLDFTRASQFSIHVLTMHIHILLIKNLACDIIDLVDFSSYIHVMIPC